MDDSHIREHILRECRERELIPLAAIERGSRMIGVAHDASDYDAFVLFRQAPAAYIKLGGYTDTFSTKLEDDELDIHGWNIQKFAQLAKDSNPTAMEMAVSDKRYFTYVRDALDAVSEDLRQNFNHMAAYNHYLSLAKNNYRKYIESGNDCTYNRQFYVLRATLMAKHIRVEGTFPELNVWQFMRQTDALEKEELGLMERFAKRKENGELGKAPNLVKPIFDEEYPHRKTMEPTDERVKQPSIELLNELIEESIF